MFKLPAVILSAALSAAAQTGEPAKPPSARVPTYPNSTCPIMGKKVSMSLFIDTEVGRFYVCCKPCYKKILADLPAAHKTAYPVVKTVSNATCPVSGEPVGEHKQSLTLQGFQFDLCCAGCVDTARSNSQIVLSKLDEAKLQDIGNATCPVTGDPTADNAFVVIGDAIVRLANPSSVAEVEKDPKATLAKAIELASKQPAKPPHVHRPAKPADDGKGENKNEKKNATKDEKKATGK